MIRPAAASALALLALQPATARAELPDPVRAMIEAAFATNDTAQINAVVAAAKATNPADTAEVDAMVNGRLARLAAAQEAQREGASFFEFVHGNVEFGASFQNGNTNSTGAYGSAAITQQSPHWRHQLSGRGDYLRTNGITTTERFSGQYLPNYLLSPRLYIYGLAQYEHDRILGYNNRFTVGPGLGYTVVNRPTLKVDFSAGPAYRHTDFVFDPTEDALAGRGTFSLRWQITPRSSFSQDAALYVETGQTSATATSILDTVLIGRLHARLSLDVLYERDAPFGTDPVDTTTRATLMYAF